MSTRNRSRPSAPSSPEVLDEETSFRWGEDAPRPSSVSTRQGLKFYSGFEWNGVQYRQKDCVFIANAEAPDPNDINQLYVARLEELCDLGEDSKLGYRYQGWVTWYIRPAEARNDDITLPDDVHDTEVLLSNPKTSNKKIDLESIQSRCTVMHVPEHVNNYEWANNEDDKGNPQLYCRFQIINRRKLKPVISPHETPPKASTSRISKKNDSAVEGQMNIDPLPLEYRNIIKQEAIVNLSPKKTVSPIKLMRSKTKENQYSPEKRIKPVSPSQGSVDELSMGISDLVVRTPRSALNEIKSNQTETPQTPRSTNPGRTDSTATTRSGRKVRRAMFFDEEEVQAPPAGSSIQQLDELKDEDLVSEDSYVKSTGTESMDESDEEITSSDDDVIVKRKTNQVKTPSRRTKRTSPTRRGSTRSLRRAPATPKGSNASRLTERGTPRMQSRRVVHKGPKNDFENALEKLHVCAVPDQLSCRETQFAEIYDFVESRLSDETGGCMYISGVPGTGKTATVCEVMEALKEAQTNEEVAKFKYIEINGMKLTEPHQAYVQILKQLTCKKATPEHAAEMLTKIFKGKMGASTDEMIVLLADELDLLWTRKQDVLYNLFDWPTHPSSRLVVIAIANTMDLPERMVMNKVASRMGLCRMTFQPYTFHELQEIVRARLAGLELMDPDAVQFVSRKVAALSGDARRALDVCRRSVELSGRPDHQGPAKPPASPTKRAKKYPVTMSHVNQAIQEMFSSAKVMAISSLSLHEQLLLRAIVEEFKRTGVEETVFHKVYSQYETLARLDGVAPVNCTLLSTMLARLGSSRLVTLSDSRHDFHQKISMNVTQDDVHFALSRLNMNDNSEKSD